ncbi:hypothetical protein K8354_15625 [Polaribacter litorisediminis]|uniref:hypothetical protein n=1 Tax=Polaribacter litorisediminis TaxID=1908341 RepID=UPI001CBD17D1|nr:hypothetical protein [Polaribacter litorisediminis]UAM97707.1 hypothetical protein K8354_15625 [Polaribacter litorisediminis]
MKVIKNILLVIITVLFLSCEKEDNKRFTGENNSFVRFFLLVDSNNGVLEFPEKDGGLVATSQYLKDNLKTLKIPVAITAGKIENTIDISFTANVIGLTNYTITPAKTISFHNEKRVDTIYIKVNEKWDLTNNPEIKLSLTNSSNNAISLGIPNDNLSNKDLTINFTETNFPYSFDINRKEIEGINDESFDFKVLFPNGFIAADIENTALFSTPSTFNYSIEQKPITKEDEVEFTFTVHENLAEDTSLDTSLSLADIPNYVKGINKYLDINKPIKIDREGNPALNFYDLSNPFYRLFGEYWRYNTNDMLCEWRSTSVFPKPVIVDKNNTNGFLYSDNGTPNDESDDIYHHQYKLGFVGNFAPVGTNPFALRNLFNGASVESPGFNLVEAIEFFPKDGNNHTEGIVNVVTQRIVILKSGEGTAFNVPISGTGTYKLMDATSNLWKIDMEILVDCSEINGEIITRNYILYNNRNYPDPEPINVPCPSEIDL